MRKLKKITVLGYLLVALFFGQSGLALALIPAVTPVPCPPEYLPDGSRNPAADIPPLQCLESVFDKALTAFFSLAGVVAFLYLIAGGFKYITAGGDEKAVSEAQKMITQAVLGLLIVVGAWALLSILSFYLFGGTPFSASKIFQFNIP